MKDSILKSKSFDFAVQVLVFCQQLKKENRQYVVTRQILRSGTAIGALIREAEFGQSRADFISKMSIALKEANETEYWLELLKSSGEMTEERILELSRPLKNRLHMLIATIKTAKANK